MWVNSVKIEDWLPVGEERGRVTGKRDRSSETERTQETHASTFSSTTTASVTASTLCEATDTAADVVAEDAFVAGVGHD